MDVVKKNQKNETLISELDILEERIRQEIGSYDQSEFADENVEYVFCIFYLCFDQTFCFHLNRQIIQLLKKFDILHMKKSIPGEDDNDERYFLHTYDDYFS
jgi:hypothetical protein